MTKKIGVTCDNYKVKVFRKRLSKDYTLEFDGPSGRAGVHLFRIECDEADFARLTKEIHKTLKGLEIEVKRSN